MARRAPSYARRYDLLPASAALDWAGSGSMEKVLDVARTICTIVGALTLWAAVTGLLASWVLQRAKRGRPNRRTEGAGSSGSMPSATNSTPGQPTVAGMQVDRRAQTWADVPSWVARDRR